MILRQKYLIDEIRSVPCPPGEHPVVWGNPHEKTGRQVEAYRRVMSREAWAKKIEHLEQEWLRRKQEHEAFMDKQRQWMNEAKTVDELLAEGCFIHPSDADEEWLY